MTLIKYKLIAKSTLDYVEEFIYPEDDEHRFRYLDEFGIAKPGSRASPEDVLISKKKTFTSVVNGKNYTYEFVTLGGNEDGIVHTVMKTSNPEGHPIVKVKVKVRVKFASRTAAKSVIGLILDDAYMPYEED